MTARHAAAMNRRTIRSRAIFMWIPLHIKLGPIAVVRLTSKSCRLTLIYFFYGLSFGVAQVEKV
ncbi:hypothetical protein BVRB_4g085720 [Beta vulgaris subsp. vulgaris]|nr:hypothetical protein BVRB_4g085720 [Beta vulgaris subsp. vulgaris]